VLKKGDLDRFWLDPWLNGESLSVKYHLLFNISLAQEVTFYHVVSTYFNSPFRRRFMLTCSISGMR
jgi:hypothetical protein